MPEQTNTIEDSLKENGQEDDVAKPSEPEPTEASPTVAEPTTEPAPTAPITTAPEPTMPAPDNPVLTTDKPAVVEPPITRPTPEPPVEPTLPISTPVSSEPLPTSDSAETIMDKQSANIPTEQVTTGLGVGLLAKLKEKLIEARQKKQQKITANLEKIMAYALEKQRISNDEVESLTKISDRQALRYLNLLVKQGRLVRFGNKRNTFYKPLK